MDHPACSSKGNNFLYPNSAEAANEAFSQAWCWNGRFIHLDFYRMPEASAKLIVFQDWHAHRNRKSASLINNLFKQRLEIIVVNIPGCINSPTTASATMTYKDWVRLGGDLVDAELSCGDDRAIVLCDFSAGGMLAYDVASLSRKVDGVIGMTFRDPLIQHKENIASDFFLVARTWSDYWKSKAAIAFCTSYGDRLEPERFDVCAILMAHPEQVVLTPPHLSDSFLKRIRRAPVHVVRFKPIEGQGLFQMRDTIKGFVLECSGASWPP